jgi:hypothetical protein
MVMRFRRSYCIGIGLAIVVLGACTASINSPIRIGDGETVSGSLSTVNGTITVGSDTTIAGTCRAVNGLVDIGARTRVEGLTTVNGSIRTREGVKVDGEVESVNGPIQLGEGTEVSGDVATINGMIEMLASTAMQDVVTVNGDIRLLRRSVVRGDVIVKDKMGSSTRNQPLRIEIAEGSTVEGSIIVEDDDLDVRVILRDGGSVTGTIQGAEVETDEG